MIEYQNIKIFLQKVTLQIGLKKFSRLKKFKTLCHGHMLLMTSREEIFGTFYKKELQKNKSERV